MTEIYYPDPDDAADDDLAAQLAGSPSDTEDPDVRDEIERVKQGFKDAGPLAGEAIDAHQNE